MFVLVEIRVVALTTSSAPCYLKLCFVVLHLNNCFVLYSQIIGGIRTFTLARPIFNYLTLGFILMNNKGHKIDLFELHIYPSTISDKISS